MGTTQIVIDLENLEHDPEAMSELIGNLDQYTGFDNLELRVVPRALGTWSTDKARKVGLALYSQIRKCRAQIHGHVTSLTSGAGVLIFFATDKLTFRPGAALTIDGTSLSDPVLGPLIKDSISRFPDLFTPETLEVLSLGRPVILRT